MSLPTIWIPALVIAHFVAISLLVYSVWTLFWRKTADFVATTPTRTKSSLRPAGNSVTVRWESLSCFIRGSSGQQVLFDCNGYGNSGEVIGIMGPSGAGKSTMMDIILGERDVYRCQGNVFVNDQLASRAGMSSISSYVPQHVPFVPSLSVKETVTFRARLTPSSLQDVEESVMEVLRVTGETGSVCFQRAELSILSMLCCGQVHQNYVDYHSSVIVGIGKIFRTCTNGLILLCALQLLEGSSAPEIEHVEGKVLWFVQDSAIYPPTKLGACFREA